MADHWPHPDPAVSELIDKARTDAGKNREALAHARWHTALDNPAAEPPGPILDHIVAALGAAEQRGAERALAPIRAFHDRLGETDLDDLDALAVWEDLGALLAGGQPC